MKIAAIISNDKIKGDHILILSKHECQILQSVFTKFCEQNKRQIKAKKMLKEFDDNLQIW